MDIIEGKNPVLELLKGERKAIKILISKGVRRCKTLAAIEELAKKKRIPIEIISKERFAGVARTKAHQGVIAQAESYHYRDLEDFLDKVKEKPDSIVVILDEVTDPQNLGSIIRSAEVFGIDGLIITKNRSAPITSTTYKASAGAVEHLDIIQVGSLGGTVKALKDAGFWVFAVDGRGERTYYEADFSGKVCLILGGEDKGVGRLLFEGSDFSVRIPMRGKTGSLNVAVAAAIVMCEASCKSKGA
ncbi:MAG: 23S rRNA (guanosine(2251)-2'-O)-methyltransferase RlmB [Actinomycetota bacterium]|nr:23S rRNA (guanosine(2251)-2'-O)-methyltransferase RlmB [Actinomycetota bacterium]